MLGFTDNFLVACAEAMKVSALMTGMVGTLPHLVSSIAQTAAGRVTDRLGGRLKALKKLIVIQFSALFPLIFLPFTPEKFRYPAGFCAVFFVVGGAIPGPAWLSLMSDHLPHRSRGKYFGWRNRILGGVSMACGLFAGQILNLFKENPISGFAVLFGLAFICRVVSWSFLIRMFDPPERTPLKHVEHEVKIPDSFYKFLRQDDSENQFLKFSIFMACFMFSVNIVSPYLAVYMLRDLHYSYATFSYVTFSAALTSLFGMKVWGELDRFGNLRIAATTLFIAAVPILWFVSGDPVR